MPRATPPPPPGETAEPLPRPTFASSRPAYVEFFFDKRHPPHVRAIVLAVVVGVLLYPFFALRSSGRETPRPAPAEKAEPPARKPARDGAQEDAAVPADKGAKQPDAAQAPALPAAPPAIDPLFAKVDGVFPMPIALVPTESGDMWLATMQDITELRGGDITKRTKKLDSATYDSMFENDLPPITAMGHGPANELWTGSKDGEIMRYSNYDWRVMWSSNDPIGGRVRAITSLNDNVYLGGKGLWKFNRTSGKLSRFPAFKDVTVWTFAETAQHKLFMGTKSGVWVLTEKGWTLFWSVPPGDENVRAIAADDERGLLAGTENGIVKLSAAGVVLERVLPGNFITALATEPVGAIWAGTKADGLKHWSPEKKAWFQAGESHGAPGNSVELLMLDKEKRLWIGTAGKGMFVANTAKLAAWIEAFPDKSKLKDASAPHTYLSACKATEEELKEATLSGDIAIENLDGVRAVFFNGHQVCPAGIAYRRADASIAALNQWQVLLFGPSKREELTVPKEYPADQAKAVLLDSSNRIWIGTNGAGVIMFDGSRWMHWAEDAELGKNPIAAIAEDSQRNIWVGSQPPFDNESKSYQLPSLHRWNGQEWAHFSPLDGLGFWTTTSLLLLRDGRLAVGTNGGLSLVDEKGITNYRDRDGLTQRYVFSISQDVNGDIWLGHLFWGEGLTWYDGTAFHTVNSGQGLFNDRISGVAHDAQGRVWVLASNGGVGVYPRTFFELKAAETTAREVRKSQAEQAPEVPKRTAAPPRATEPEATEPEAAAPAAAAAQQEPEPEEETSGE